ncbi:MAG: DUF1294 domain-containing protein [Bacilli bacterium]|jgi:uncharacterized membrane protein YsdA (DUF1294 family)|nr:DUF1294 domain-containing protein [Bacilli bacterium]
MTYNQIVLLVYVGYLLLFSLITFILFLVDKQLAIKEKTRIKEKVLLFFVAIGGGIGGYFGRILGHHKTKKIYFSLIINLTLILQLLILGAMITTIVIGSK